MPARGKVEVGQRFRQAGGNVVWEVQAVFARPGEPPHVRLVHVNDHHRLKTVGMSVVLDRQMFEAVDDQA